MSGIKQYLVSLAVALTIVGSQALAQAPSPSSPLPKPMPSSPAAWSQTAQDDIRAAAAITAENHPGMVDPANPTFPRLLAQAQVNGLALARDVKDASGYVAAIRRFSNTLQDGHAGVSPTLDSALLPKPKWPGFVAVWRGNAMLVYNSQAGGPGKGARITQCDGVTIKALVMRNVFTFRGRPSEPGNWWVDARRLFVDGGNPFVTPPQTCTFVENGRTSQRPLIWRETDAIFDQWRDDSYNGVTLPVGMTTRPSGLVWIAMPNFGPNVAEQSSYRAIVAEISAERETISQARAIVLDLRDNQGGSSVWSRDIANALWGRARRNRLMGLYLAGENAVRWRTSNGNARHVEALIPTFLAQGMPDVAAEWTKIYQGMDAARGRGEPLFTEAQDGPARASAPAGAATVATPAVPAPDELPLPRAPIYVIVPGQCASACLDAVDVFTRFENVKLIGAPSSADSTYMDIRRQELPSGLASVIIPNKVYVGRPRSAGFAYQPAIEVRDIDWSTQVFEDVVLRDIAKKLRQ